MRRFESSLISSAEHSLSLEGFTQFVFDNADFNVATMTGHNTFHAMGGIACVTPAVSTTNVPIKRKTNIEGSDVIGKFGTIPIKFINKPPKPALHSITVYEIRLFEEEWRTFPALDAAWMIGYVLSLKPCLPWSGFMKSVTSCEHSSPSRIEVLPFINLEPSNPSTIYTALCYAQKLCDDNNLRVCIVTFDQPLYQKASEIVASSNQLQTVVVRLGGFHLLMSYMGSIGHIMGGSGIEDLWKCVYAKDSVAHMVTGECQMSHFVDTV